MKHLLASLCITWLLVLAGVSLVLAITSDPSWFWVMVMIGSAAGVIAIAEAEFAP